MPCTPLFDSAVSDEVIERIRDRLGQTTVRVERWDPKTVIAWLGSDEAHGKFVIGNRDWVFTDPDTAFAFKMKFG